MKPRHVYRVTATYTWGQWQKCYLTRRAAHEQARRRAEGYLSVRDGGNGMPDEVPVEPAQTVRVEESEPVIWPQA